MRGQVNPAIDTSCDAHAAAGKTENPLTTCMKGVRTVTSLAKCFPCGKKKKSGAPGQPKPAQPKQPQPPGHGKRPAGPGEGKRANRPPQQKDGQQPQEGFVDFPSGFDEEFKGEPSDGPTNWNLAKRTTVAERWKLTT